MADKLTIGIMGAGVFGGYHAGKIPANPTAISNVYLAGIYDPDPKRAQTLARRYGCPAYDDQDAFLADMQAVIIAVPAIYHGACALAALKAGCHVLVEKPIAPDLETAAAMIQIAREKRLVLQVGHQERFVLKAIGLDRVRSKPTRIAARRMSAYSARGTDVSVTLDLMSHDLDLILWLMGETPQSISSHVQAVHGPHPDAALAHIQFATARARLEASRVETGSTRTLHLSYPEGDIFIDFNARTLRHNTPFDLNPDFAEHSFAKDALGAADQAFIASVTQGAPVAITGEAGLAALRCALYIDGVL